jgi:hypothetical protein
MRKQFKTQLLCLVFFISALGFAQEKKTSKYDIPANYTKQEVDIAMRDGVKLHTTIYSPKDKSQEYPIIMMRTPYSSKPYGKDNFPESAYRMAGNKQLVKQGNIFVKQDVRGRWMSEGDFDNMRPYIPNKTGDQTDEASDTYDAIEWLINNVENNNGKVGIWGISYPGFYSTYALLSDHPALKAVSPQASISDFFFDDFHHNGAYLLSYFMATSLFGKQNPPTTEPNYHFPDIPSKDQYSFFLENTPIKKLDKYYPDNFFWDQLKNHPNYDEFWQSRSILPHLKDIKPAVMYVGGLFDAEDLYGPFQSYKKIEESSDNFNIITYGPWSHGQWVSTKKRQALGNVFFGDSISINFQRDVVTPFFNHFLKDKKKFDLPEARMYDTGERKWDSYADWPPKNASPKRYYLGKHNKFSESAKPNHKEKFVSDIENPVPYSEDIKVVFTPRKYMTDDQRFAARRPDVLTYTTPVLKKDLKMAGEINADLQVATTGTDADWIVKVVDVYPADAKDYEETQKYLKMSNYHMMVRSEVMPGRFRNSFSDPEAMKANKKTEIEFTLQGINHTFKKGHKMQIQIQSTWFPFINLNPQTFVPNIFKADESDYKTQTHTIYGDSYIEFKQLN